MTYCISDIHGCYESFMNLLKEMNFGQDDTLYILGDAIDRGPQSVDCLKYIINHPNIHMLVGNHEQMMMDYLRIEEGLGEWLGYNGGGPTYVQYLELAEDEMGRIFDYLCALPYWYDIELDGKKYLLVHAGLGVTAYGRDADMATLLPKQGQMELLWSRKNFFLHPAVKGYTIIFGHTRTSDIRRDSSHEIWHDPRYHDKIGIDCGVYSGGMLGALRLDDMQEFYVPGLLDIQYEGGLADLPRL